MAGEHETRFVELMAELFQLNEAEALDFGIYRVIKRHNREIRAFLGEIGDAAGTKTLHGGRLAAILDEAFSSGATGEQQQKRLAELESMLKIAPGMPAPEREQWLQKASDFRPDEVAEYRNLLASLAGGSSRQMDRAEVLNHLYRFFSRHYQDGDFIVQRCYGRDGARYIRSTGDDTEFHWATEDMYYIKSGDTFTDFPVRLHNGQRVVFSVEPESLQATRAVLKPNDKAHYALDKVSQRGDEIVVSLNYLKGSAKESSKKAIIEAIQEVGAGGAADTEKDITRWLNRFIARNQSDFFIHKRLKEALSEALEIFIKTDVLDADQLLTGGDLAARAIAVARVVRDVGRQIIDFLAVLEDFQKALWEKKKLVFETRYVITLDRLERYCPDWLALYIKTIVKKQAAEWKDLGLGEYRKPADCIRKVEGDLVSAGSEQYLPLPVDTQNFDSDFKWAMLRAVTEVAPLDDALDGIAINSDNWQALNTIVKKYQEQARTIYIDPPYNTDAGPIDYKNGYRNASWMALMDDRLKLGQRLMRDDGVLCCTIDDYEQKPLGMLLERVFGENSIAGVVSIRINPSGRPKPSGFAVSHEYGFFVQNSSNSALDRLDRTDAQMKRYKEADDDGSYMWELFRKRGSNSERSARRTLYYPLYVSDAGIRVPRMVWDETIRSWVTEENPKTGETLVFPIDDNKIERTWRYKHDDVNKKPTNFRATKDNAGVWTIYYKYRPSNPGVLPTTMWIDSKFSATEHGTGMLKKLFKKHDAFSYPKSVFAVVESLKVCGATNDDALVIDFFAGSCTTAHAVMQMNTVSDTNTRFLVVEVNKYFDAVTLPRIKKVAASLDWEDGSAMKITGPGTFVRVHALEQYDDTLENLDVDVKDGESCELLFENATLALRYRFDQVSRAMYCGTERFTSPFCYKLKRAEGTGEGAQYDVDLTESLPYLLGLTVNRLYREDTGVVMTGRNRRSESVSIFFRDCAHGNSAEWVRNKLIEHPADRVYANAPAELCFSVAEKLESIESVFALQFGRA